MAATYPRLSWHWPHLKLIFAALQEVADGTLSRLLISMPPQHGKTESTTVRFPVYAMLRRPGVRVGLASYSQTYANRLSRKVRRAAMEAGRRIGGKDAANEWELADGSSLYAVGVGGGITGRSIDLMVIDDPVKGRQEADSEAFRDRAWEWYADDITTRMQEGTAVVMIQTRWHLDDLAGRVLASDEGPKWKYLRLPAVAEADDPMGRAEGEPLCPDRFTLATLLDRRRNSPETFEALYQQNPVPRGGLFFRREWFPLAPTVPEVRGVRRVRYWDLAGSTKDTACWTAGVLLAYDGTYYYVEHVERFRLGPAERNDMIRRVAELDAGRRGFERTYFEEQPGAAGIETSQAMVRRMAGLPVRADRVTGDKRTRAEPLADAARGGLVRVVEGPWVTAYLNELTTFPRGASLDQVDSSSGAYNLLAKGAAGLSVGAGR